MYLASRNMSVAYHVNASSLIVQCQFAPGRSGGRRGGTCGTFWKLSFVLGGGVPLRFGPDAGFLHAESFDSSRPVRSLYRSRHQSLS